MALVSRVWWVWQNLFAAGVRNPSALLNELSHSFSSGGDGNGGSSLSQMQVRSLGPSRVEAGL